MTPCIWTLRNNYEEEYYDTACGETFIVIDGTLQANNFVYCPNCGGQILEVKPIPEIEESEG